jgi:hypothetical protein
MFKPLFWRRVLIARAYALFSFALLVCVLLAQHARAQTASGGLDVTSDVQTALMTVISAAILAVMYYVRDWAKNHTGGQSEQLDWNSVTAWLQAAAHSEVYDHLMTGKTVTLDTKSELGNRLLAQARTGIAMEVKRLGLSDATLAHYAEAAVAQVLNATPSAPPFLAPPAPVAQGAPS